MFKVKVFTMGKEGKGWLKEALKEYEKRMAHVLEISWVFFKEETALWKQIQKAPFIALDPSGELFDSPSWAKKMESLGAVFHLLIGGDLGIPPQILEKAYLSWSLSPLTFTHQMTRLILTEQLYRATEILKKSPYHK